MLRFNIATLLMSEPEDNEASLFMVLNGSNAENIGGWMLCGLTSNFKPNFTYSLMLKLFFMTYMVEDCVHIELVTI